MKINEISTEELTRQVNVSNSYSELCRRLNIPDNGKYRQKLKDVINNNNIIIPQWDKYKNSRKYEIVEKVCPVCNAKFSTKLNAIDEKTTCSYKCSNIYFTEKRNTPESNLKKSSSIRKYLISSKKDTKYCNRICRVCDKSFLTVSRKSNSKTYCSKKCSAISRSTDLIYRDKLRQSALIRIKEGRHNGWKSRNILSYPEKFFISVLNNNDIQFKSNEPFMGYFLDFAIDNKKIDLEIDGKQHKYPERKASDDTRDIILTQNRWKVYRIEWNSINTDDGKQRMKEKIDKFLEFYKNN